MDDGDRNGPRIAEADVEQRKVNGSKRPRFDSLPVEPDIAPLRASVPFWTIFGLVGFHGLVDGVTSTFGQFVGHPDLPNGFLFPPGQVDEDSSIFSRHAFVPQQQNADLCSRCSNSRSALIHLIDDGPHQPQTEMPEQASRDPNGEWCSSPFPRHVAQGTGV